MNPVNGNTPYTYSWNTSPIQTTQTISGLNPGIYSIKVTDAIGCFKNKDRYDNTTHTATVTTTKTQTNINCYNQNTGRAKVTASGGTTLHIRIVGTLAEETQQTLQPTLQQEYVYCYNYR